MKQILSGWRFNLKYETRSAHSAAQRLYEELVELVEAEGLELDLHS